MDITTLGIDVSKNSFHVIGANRAGKPVFRQKFTRQKLTEFIANHPPCAAHKGTFVSRKNASCLCRHRGIGQPP